MPVRPSAPLTSSDCILGSGSERSDSVSSRGGGARRTRDRRRLRGHAGRDRGVRRRRRRGAPLEDPSDQESLGGGRGRDQRRARECVRGQPRAALLRHRQGRRLPRRSGRDRDPLHAKAPDDVYELENWGAVFSRTDDGRIAQRPFGAAGAPRTAYAADITGHVLIQVLYEQVVKRDIPVYEEYFAWKLVEDGGRCVGVLAWNLLSGGLEAISAKTTILATGGAGRLYVGTTNAYACTGDGMTMALRVGVPLKDMEMMQFHPTTLAPTGVLITEGCRGEGAYLLNKDGERFLKRYAPNAMELASRDVISRAEQTEIDEGRGIDGNVMLDLRHLGAAKILERLHGTRELSMVFAGHRSDLRPDPGPARCALPHGRRRHGCPRPHGARRSLRRRRGRVHLGARRQPPRRQRADGDDHLRAACGRGCVRRRADSRRYVDGARVGGARRRSGAARAARPHARASGRGRFATSSPRRCTRTSASSGARTR